ncbi:hypothetical protein UlMin_033614 [Ulmus minor]
MIKSMPFLSSNPLIRATNASNDPFFSLDSWKPGLDCCLWHRVNCSSGSDSRVVVGLSLKSLVSILVASNSKALTTSMLKPLFHIKSLKMLSISSNGIRGEIPGNELANLSNLVHLDMMQNNFSGLVPPQVFQLRNLQFLDTGSNLLNGNLSHEVGSLQKLKILRLDENFLGGSMPEEIGKLRELSELSLRQNIFTGGIPSSIMNLMKLEKLDLRSNCLSMEIPSTIGGLSNLTCLALSDNKLTRDTYVGMIETSNTIPSMLEVLTFSIEFNDLIVNWKNSKQGLSSHSLIISSFLDLSKNQLSVEIPVSLGKLKGLKLLNISHNNILGQIPSSFDSLESMESRDLSHNKLSGLIPPTLANLNQLSTLDLSNNMLKGKIPLGGQMNTMADPASYANNSGLCGMQIYVACQDQESPQPRAQQEQEEDDNDKWFVWEGVGIGYSIGFFLTVGI